jgi:hypothetical protein
MLWIMPRGLITVVLALQVVAVRSEVTFLSALAFAVILVTNVMVIIGSLRASRHPTGALVSVRANSQPEGAENQSGAAWEPHAAAHGRWILDATMLILLGASACILWYGNQPPEQRPRSLQHWLQLHVRKQR